MALTEQEQIEYMLLLEADAKEKEVNKEFTPQKGPQTDFLNSTADIVLFGGSAGSGKALKLSTPIPTPTGWKDMGDIVVGDTVFGRDGKICNVIKAYPVMFNHTCYDVVFSDNSVITADAEHLWITLTDIERTQIQRRTASFRENRRNTREKRGTGKKPWLAELNSKREQNNLLEPPKGNIRTTQEIKDTLTVREGSRTNHSIDVANPLILPESELPIDPYVLGAWLGDGSTRDGEMTTADIEVLDNFTSVGYTWHKRPSGKYEYRIDGLTTQLRLSGVQYNKHIPSQYLRASFNQRLALLQGLMDTDGTCNKDAGDCEFTTTDKKLRDGIYELICSLGIKTTILTGRATLYGKDCGEKYRLAFYSSLPIFRLERKLKRQKRTNFRGTHHRRYIVAVNKVESVPVRCILVDSDDHCFLAGKSMIPTHNTRALLLESLKHINTPRFCAVIFRRQSTQITSPGGLWDAAMQLMPLKGAVPVLTPKPTMKFPGGGKVVFSHLQYESDVFGWQGSELPLIAFDEFTHFSRSMFLYMMSRNRSMCGVKPYMRMTTNPDADSWIADFIDWWIDDDGFPIKERSGIIRYFTVVNDEFVWGETREELAKETGLDEKLLKSFTFIPASIQDNPLLLEKDPGYLANLQSLGTVERGRLLDGNWKIKPSAGLYFKREQAIVVPSVPCKIVSLCRAWDLAATTPTAQNPSPDATAGVLMGLLEDGRYIILNLIHGRWMSSMVRSKIKQTAINDNDRYGNVRIRLPQDPGQAGKEQAQSYVSFLSGFVIKTQVVSGDKITRAEPFSSQWQAGNVLVLAGGWNDTLFKELEEFPDGKHDDICDSASDSYTELQGGFKIHLVSPIVVEKESYWG